MHWNGIKIISKNYEKNKVNNNDDGDSTSGEIKTDSETTTKLPLAKYYLTFFSNMG